MCGQLRFLVTQITFKPRPLPASIRLDEQTAIITGSNVGIGLETALQLASHGVSRVILGERDAKKGTTATDDLAKSSQQCDIQVFLLDLESFDSIISFSERVKSLDRVDIVILNAGVKRLKWTTTLSAHETNLQVNHVGPALLSTLLLPKLKGTAKQTGTPSRLSFTTSEVHFWIPFNEKASPQYPRAHGPK